MGKAKAKTKNFNNTSFPLVLYSPHKESPTKQISFPELPLSSGNNISFEGTTARKIALFALGSIVADTISRKQVLALLQPSSSSDNSCGQLSNDDNNRKNDDENAGDSKNTSEKGKLVESDDIGVHNAILLRGEITPSMESKNASFGESPALNKEKRKLSTRQYMVITMSQCHKGSLFTPTAIKV